MNELYARIRPPALRLAYLITGDYSTAEDVVHDVFLRIATKHRHLADEPYVQEYFNKAVVREIAGIRRSAIARLKRHEKALRTDNQHNDAHELTEKRLELVHHLDGLPVKTKTVLVFTYVYDYTDAQIADATGWPVGTIKSLRSRGIATLRKEFTHEQPAR